MRRRPGPLLVIGALAAIVYFGALTAVSPLFVDGGSAAETVQPTASVRFDPVASNPATPKPATAPSAVSFVTKGELPATATQTVATNVVAGSSDVRSPGPPPEAPRAAASSRLRPESAPAATPAEERMGADGQPYILRNLGAAETEANHRAQASAREAAIGEARSDPVAFAARHDLELEDLQAMIAGQRPFPDRLVAARKSGT